MNGKKKQSTENLSPEFVIGIGASAGGLEALTEFFESMPKVRGISFVVVQHLSPDFKSLMDQLLAKVTDYDIYPAEHEMKLFDNTIYLIPPKKNMTISSGRLMLNEQMRGGYLNLPIDIFFRSLAHEAKDKAIAIILSGTGSDGSSGIVEISGEGGLAICQDLDTAKFDGMPKSAMATRVVNKVLPPKEMPAFITQYTKNPVIPSSSDERELAYQPTGVYGEIFSLLFKKHKIDFGDYKEKTIVRRIDRRIKTLLLSSLEEYVKHLRNHSDEVDQLYYELLIGVTSFFRDTEAFKLISKNYIPQLFKNNSENRQIRIWIPSCSTGEEAYSFAIILREYANKMRDAYDIKIFSSDLNRQLLARASSGRFFESQIAGLSPEYLAKYFRREGDYFQVTNDLRNMIVFAPQNLLVDPPFTQVDLVSCRNMLIYIKSEQQQRIITSFHFALKKGGFLFLGPSESLGALGPEFSVEDHTWKIFKKITDGKYPFANPRYTKIVQRSAQPVESNKMPVMNVKQNIYDALVQSFYNECLIVDKDEAIIHIQKAKKYLDFQTGVLSTNISQMIHPSLRSVVMSALYRVQNEKQEVEFTNVEFEEEEITIGVKPLVSTDDSGLLVAYAIHFIKDRQQSVEPKSTLSYKIGSESREMIHDLEEQLQMTRESLQSTLQDSETTNEELQSTNEELLASNEELQSTNEELHSVNEELYTVNSEYQSKISELSQLEGDIDNLLHSTEIGTVFLDREMKIRKYTPAINATFGIMPQDIGRSIDAFLFKFDHRNLLERIKAVLKSGEEEILEPKIYNSAWFTLKLLPYMKKGEISGVVLSFIDVDVLKKAQDESSKKDKRLASAYHDLDDLSGLTAHDLKALVRWTRSRIDVAEASIDEPSFEKSKVRECFSEVKDILNSIESMVHGLVSFSKIGKEEPNLAEVDIEPLILRCAEQVNSKAEKKGEFIIQVGIPPIECDHEKISKVFESIFQNSIDFQKSDHALVVDVGHIRGDHEEHVFSIRDNGIGIADNELSSAFKIFKKLDRSGDLDRGNGVGLSLCKRVVLQHGGKIWADSTPGVGSVFYFSIPKNKEKA